jgi:hypothetical protein
VKRDSPSWARSFGLLFGLLTTWSLATPLFAGPDEPAHVIKAVATVGGTLTGEPTAQPTVRRVSVPAIYTVGNRSPVCYQFKGGVSAKCAPRFQGGHQKVDTETPAGLYPPPYYGIVGLPSLGFASALGVYLMRMISAAICAALLASTLQSAALSRSRQLLTLGIGVVVTPMLLFLGGTVSPSSVEIAAAIAFWASGLLLLEEDDFQQRRRLIVRGTIAGALLMVTRTTSPFMFLLVASLVLLSGSRAQVRRLLRDREVWISGAVLFAVLAASIAWLVSVVLPGQSTTVVDDRSINAVLHEVLGRQVFNLKQMVGYFGWLDSPAPKFTYFGWFTVASLLLLMGIGCGRLHRRLMIVLVAGAASIGPVVVETLTVRNVGIYWQGRYTMPVAVGALLLACLAVDENRRARAVVLRGSPAILVVLASSSFAAFLALGRRFAVGLNGTLRFWTADAWAGPVGWPLLLAAGLALTTLLYLWLGSLLGRPRTQEWPEVIPHEGVLTTSAG